MDCRELSSDVLLDFADWRLSPAERHPVARHLEACQLCRGRRDELEAVAEAVRHTREIPPPLLLDELDRTIPTWPRPAANHGRRVLPFRLLAAAGLLLVAAGAFAFVRWVDHQKTAALAVRPLSRPPEAPPTPALPPSLPPRRTPPSTPAPEARRDEERVRDPRVLEVPVPPPGPAAQPPLPLPGDLNGDGVVDIADARILLRRLTLGLPLPPSADVNGDGVADIADVRCIIRAVVAPR